MRKNPTIATGINYQNKWENATKEDENKGNITKSTQLIYDEYDPINRRNYNGKDNLSR